MTAVAAMLLPLLWPWLAGACGLGLVIGTATCATSPARSVGTALVWLAVLLGLVLAGVVGLGIVPGQAGFRLELGLALLLAYLAGCGMGCLGRRIVRA